MAREDRRRRPFPFPLLRNARPNGAGSTLVDWRLQSTPFTTFTMVQSK